jgi:ribonucleoside-diphosphate reductase alpha chain
MRHDEVGDRIYVHPIYQDIIKNNEATPSWFVDSADLKPEDHFETQVIIQKYTDGAISKTINTPKGFKPDQLSHLLLEYIRDLKGVTLYVDGSREEQILVPIKSKKEVKKYIDEGKVHTEAEELSCGTGTCEV